MSTPVVPTPPFAGLPDPSSIITELTLEPPVNPVAAAEPPTTYRIFRTNQRDTYDHPLTEAALVADAIDTWQLEQSAGPQFRGTSRKAAKLSIVDADPEVFTDLADLIASLPAESKLTHHHPPIKTGATSGRVPLERRNVRVRAFLYAASREDDND